MFGIRIKGKFSHPSARIVPLIRSAPILAAVSRELWNPTRMPSRDEIDALSLYALVVVTVGTEPARARCVRLNVHVLGAVAKRAEIGDPHEGGSGERGLHPEHPSSSVG